jgi:poly-gamma-glutamate capsule biosynthesis protein CapA/YwtB (metallophosphatase superfamily)
MMRERLPERLVPPDWLVKWTHAEVDAGADIIVMHGAPLLHGVEIYRDRPIFFDLGNFIFQTALANVWEPIAWESVVAYVDFAGTTLKSIEFRPIVVEKIGQSQADTRARTISACRQAACPEWPQASRLTRSYSGWLICLGPLEQTLRSMARWRR